MAKNDNLTDFLVDVADAIREKEGSSEPINPQEFSDRIRSLSGSGSGWTGHADAEGLRAIGWDDEDIAFFQEHGVDWNAEDDEYHKVSEENKALYGLDFFDVRGSKGNGKLHYLPKIDNKYDNLNQALNTSKTLVGIPKIDFSKATVAAMMFVSNCSLLCVPELNIGHITSAREFFSQCRSLRYVGPLDLANVTDAEEMFSSCSDLPHIKLSNTQKIEKMVRTFYGCISLVTIDELDMQSVTDAYYAFYDCISLKNAYLKNLKVSILLSTSYYLSKESLLYIIDNEAAPEAITISLASYAYQRLAEDADIVAALANHPNVSLASV